MLANFDGCGTRFSQTVLAVSPKLTALLGNAKGRSPLYQRKKTDNLSNFFRFFRVFSHIFPRAMLHFGLSFG